MKQIIPIQHFNYRNDVERIVELCKANDLAITNRDAYQVWLDYSESMAAGWMTLPVDDKRVLQIVLMYSREI